MTSFGRSGAAMLATAMAILTVSSASAMAGATGAHTSSTTGPAYSLSFSPNKPAKPSGLTLNLVTPTEPSSAAVAFPAGTSLNLGAVPACGAPPACDPSTQVGSGSAKVTYSTFTIPLSFTVFNRAGGLAVVISNPNGTPYIILPTWSGTKLVIPYTNAYYKGVPIQVAQIQMSFFSQVGSGSHAYLRTPASCPKTGWRSSAAFTFPAGDTVVNSVAKCQTPVPVKKKTRGGAPR